MHPRSEPPRLPYRAVRLQGHGRAPAAVSYTHLDVYKRQSLYLATLLGFMLLYPILKKDYAIFVHCLWIPFLFFAYIALTPGMLFKDINLSGTMFFSFIVGVSFAIFLKDKLWHIGCGMLFALIDVYKRQGCANLSLDLMWGLPGPTLEQWLEDARAAIALGPEHISAYGLTLEPGTPLAESCGDAELPSEDVQCAMYLEGIRLFEEAGPVSYTHLDVYKRQPQYLHIMLKPIRFISAAVSVQVSFRSHEGAKALRHQGPHRGRRPCAVPA